VVRAVVGVGAGVVVRSAADRELAGGEQDRAHADPVAAGAISKIAGSGLPDSGAPATTPAVGARHPHSDASRYTSEAVNTQVGLDTCSCASRLAASGSSVVVIVDLPNLELCHR
jgi:hypothetical protein